MTAIAVILTNLSVGFTDLYPVYAEDAVPEALQSGEADNAESPGGESAGDLSAAAESAGAALQAAAVPGNENTGAADQNSAVLGKANTGAATRSEAASDKKTAAEENAGKADSDTDPTGKAAAGDTAAGETASGGAASGKGAPGEENLSEEKASQTGTDTVPAQDEENSDKETPSDPETYTVSFDLCGHGEAVPPVTAEAGTMLMKPADPQAEGFVFKGWYRDASMGTAWNFSLDVVDGDMTLYARWDEAEESEEESDSGEEGPDEEGSGTDAHDGIIAGETGEYAPADGNPDEKESAETKAVSGPAEDGTAAEGEAAEGTEAEKKEGAEKEEKETAEKTENEEEDAEKDPAEQEPLPAYSAFSQSVTVDGVTVSVSAEAGVFPDGSVLSVELVSAGQTVEAVSEAGDEARIAAAYTFDVCVLNGSGEEIQPAEGKTVNVSFTMAEAAQEELEAAVYHMTESGSADGNAGGDGLTVEKLDVTVSEAEETVTAVSTGFSLYQVVFYYEVGTSQQPASYIYMYDGPVLLSYLLKKMGLDNKGTVVSDPYVIPPEDFEVKPAGEDYEIIYNNTPGSEWAQRVLTVRLQKGDVTNQYSIKMENAANSTADGWINKDNQSLNWSYDNSGKILSIAGNGAMTVPGQTDDIGLDKSQGKSAANKWLPEDPWKAWLNDIEEVVIGKGITTIGQQAFRKHANLKTVTVNGDGLTSIGKCAFYECRNLKKLDLSSCSNLESIGLGEGKNESVFLNNSILSEISFPDAFTWVDKNAFNGCKSLNLPAAGIGYCVGGNGALYNLQDNGSANKVLNTGEETLYWIPTAVGDDPAAASYTLPYTGSDQALVNAPDLLPDTGKYSIRYTLDGETVSELPKRSQPGTYVVGYTIVLPDGTQSKTGSYSVTNDPKPMTDDMLSLDQAAFDYNAASQGPVLTVKDGDQVLEEGVDYVIVPPTVISAVNAGTYTITVSGKGRYTGNASAGWSIRRASLQITVKPQTYIYNGYQQGEPDITYDDSSVIAGKVEVTGLQGKDFISSITLNGEQTEIGEYTGDDGINVTGFLINGDPEAKDNYETVCAAGTLTIEAKPVTVTITGNTDSVTYDGREHKTEGYKAEISDPLYTADKIVFTGKAEITGTDAGTYLMGLAKDQFSNSDQSFNVTFVVSDGELTIAQKAASIIVADAEKDFGEADPPFTGTVEGLVKEGDLGEIRYIRAGQDEEAGTYKGVLTASYTENKNYEVSVKNGDFTIRGPIPVKKAILTFDLAGGTLDGKTGTFTVEAEIGATIRLPEAPVRDGYRFRVWKGSEYEAGAQYKVEGDHTFTAKWEQIVPPGPSAHTVTFDVNGHGTAPASQSVKDGEKAVRPADPSAPGWVFGGWYLDKACTKAYDFSSPVKSDITLFARWTAACNPGGGPAGTVPGAKTGDGSRTLYWIVLAAAAELVLLLAVSKKRRLDRK